MNAHGKLQVGVVGVGSMGGNHARVYADLSDARLVGIFDPDTSRAIEVAREHGAHAFGSVTDLLRSVDAVTIACPTSAHLEIATAAIEHGLHILIEKPLAASLSESQRILDLAATSRDRIHMVGHIERFNPTVIALRDMIAGRTIRSVTMRRMSPFGNRALDTDVIHDLMIHDIDLALMLLGDDVASIDAVGTPVRTTFIDQAMAELSMIDGVQVNLIASRVANRRLRTIEIRGDNFRITADLLERSVHIAHGTTGALNHRIDTIPVAASEPLRIELQHFIDSVFGRVQNQCDLAAGHRAMTVAGCILDIVARSNDANPDLAIARLAD